MILSQLPEIVIASHNNGKVKEISELLAHFSCKITSAKAYDLVSPEETEDSFEGNALLKARYVADKTGKAALADDSGLSVTALNGNPGIYSARWAKEGTDFDYGIQKIQSDLEACHTEDYSAAFYCALCLFIPQKNQYFSFLGTVKGNITFPPRGKLGFGYDPIFIPQGGKQTFGEMNPIEKQALSHRADAFQQLVTAFS